MGQELRAIKLPRGGFPERRPYRRPERPDSPSVAQSVPPRRSRSRRAFSRVRWIIASRAVSN
jgi:hypothetical protein